MKYKTLKTSKQRQNEACNNIIRETVIYYNKILTGNNKQIVIKYHLLREDKQEVGRSRELHFLSREKWCISGRGDGLSWRGYPQALTDILERISAALSLHPPKVFTVRGSMKETKHQQPGRVQHEWPSSSPHQA